VPSGAAPTALHIEKKEYVHPIRDLVAQTPPARPQGSKNFLWPCIFCTIPIEAYAGNRLQSNNLQLSADLERNVHVLKAE